MLDRGFSAVAFVPDPLLEDPAWMDGLIQVIDLHVDTVDARGDPSRPVVAALAEQFSIENIDPGPDGVAELSRHDAIRGRVIGLSLASMGTSAQAWCEFVVRFVAASKSMPQRERPQLLIVAPGRLARWLAIGETIIDAVWWWGVLDRLDTAVYVAESLDKRDHNGLLRDTIAEVAGFDLTLASELAHGWDGTINSLLKQVFTYDVGRTQLVRASVDELPTSSTRMAAPPEGALGRWEAGILDAWDSFPAYHHASVLAAGGQEHLVKSRVWRAQVRTMMPIIDEERSRLEAWLRTQLGHRCGLPEGCEPRDLYRELQDHPDLKRWRGGHRKSLIYWLRDARNQLAHMQALEQADIERGQQLISRDRRHV